MMNDSGHKGISYMAGFFIAICFTIAGMMFGLMLTNGLWPLLSGQSKISLAEGMHDAQFTTAAKIIQSIMALVGFLLPAIATAFLLHRKPSILLGLKHNDITPKLVGLAIGIIMLSLPISGSLGYLSHQLPLPESWITYFNELESSYNNNVEGIVGLETFTQFLFSLVVMAFLPALCEEVLFRGALQGFLTRGTNKPWVAIIIVSLIFSLVHLSGYGFLSRVFLGIILGAIYYYTGRLWLSILAHFINNAIIVSMLYYYKSSGKDLNTLLNDNTGNYWGLLAISVVIILFGLLQKAKPVERY